MHVEDFPLATNPVIAIRHAKGRFMCCAVWALPREVLKTMRHTHRAISFHFEIDEVALQVASLAEELINVRVNRLCAYVLQWGYVVIGDNVSLVVELDKLVGGRGREGLFFDLGNLGLAVTARVAADARRQ